jgi:hypothetical protein
MKKAIYIPLLAILLPYFLLSTVMKSGEKKQGYENKITVTGSAKNMNGRAVVESDSAGTYYLRGLDAWQTDWLHRRVKVTGDLEKPAGGINTHIKDAVVQLLE